MYVTDGHDMTLAVKVALNPNTTTNQPTNQPIYWFMAFLSPELRRLQKPSVAFPNIAEAMISG